MRRDLCSSSFFPRNDLRLSHTSQVTRNVVMVATPLSRFVRAARLCLAILIPATAHLAPALAIPARPAPPAQTPQEKKNDASNPRPWATQRLAWEALVKQLEPLARRGARMPSPKLRQHFRRRGIWEHPSFDPSKVIPEERALLSPAGPAMRPEVNGPAGRAVWVEGVNPESPDANAQGHPPTRWIAQVCQEAERRCGLTCTFAPALPGSHGADRQAHLRALRHLRLDHGLVILASNAWGRPRLFTPGPDSKAPEASPTHTTALGRLTLALEAALTTPKRAMDREMQPISRYTLGLGVPRQGLGGSAVVHMAETLCRLGNGLPDLVYQAWTETSEAQQARADALARWLGLRFVDRPTDGGRAPLERRYIRIHYRHRVFNIRQRPQDGAHLIRPLMVVIHYTGSLSLTSALHTLRARRLGTGPEAAREPPSLSVGVPYVVARDGTVYRLFDDDARFGRHTIGLNHSALGIENVGDRHNPFTPAQLEANARLVEYAALRHPLRYLIGHREVYQMARTPYYLEAIPRYCSDKNDPLWRCLRSLRARLAYLGLVGPPPNSPMLRNCKDMHRYFRRVRRRAAEGASPISQ